MSSHPDQIRSAPCGLPLQRAVTADVLMRRVAGRRAWVGRSSWLLPFFVWLFGFVWLFVFLYTMFYYVVLCFAMFYILCYIDIVCRWVSSTYRIWQGYLLKCEVVLGVEFVEINHLMGQDRPSIFDVACLMYSCLTNCSNFLRICTAQNWLKGRSAWNHGFQKESFERTWNSTAQINRSLRSQDVARREGSSARRPSTGTGGTSLGGTLGAFRRLSRVQEPKGPKGTLKEFLRQWPQKGTYSNSYMTGVLNFRTDFPSPVVYCPERPERPERQSGCGRSVESRKS